MRHVEFRQINTKDMGEQIIMRSVKIGMKMAILMLLVVVAVVFIAFFSVRKMNEQKMFLSPH